MWRIVGLGKARNRRQNHSGIRTGTLATA
jgi:hypothetical protein